MVYLAGNQTQRYPQEQKKTTNRFFHDEPSSVEPHKSSTFGKLYNNAPFFVTERNTLNKVSALNNTLQLFPSPPAMNRSGKLSASSQISAQTFQLHTGSYSVKGVRLPAANVTTPKSEYQDKYSKLKRRPYSGPSVIPSRNF